MFRRIINSNILAVSCRVINFSPSPSSNLSGQVTIRTYRDAPRLLHSSCRLYSKDASLEDTVVDFKYVQKAAADGNILIIDVREPEEVKEHGRIPNSINIPSGTVITALSTMSEAEFESTYKRPKPSEDTEIIFYCKIGKRSTMAHEKALNLGYKNVKNYRGSWTDWAKQIQ